MKWQEYMTLKDERQDQISLVMSLSRVQLFVIQWTIARYASLSITNSWILLKFMSIESVMPSNHLILCHPVLLKWVGVKYALGEEWRKNSI